MRRTARQIYDSLTAAGLPAPAAVTLTAIALAESGGDPTARGDLALQTTTWGPSFGLFQVRTLKAETGKGTTRDIAALTSDAAQAKAAATISHGGRDFTPWTTFTSGTYRKHLPAVQAAVGVPASTTGAGTVTGPAGTPASWDPRDWPGQAVAQARPLLIEGAVLTGGLALVVLGLTGALRPATSRARRAVVGAIT